MNKFQTGVAIVGLGGVTIASIMAVISPIGNVDEYYRKLEGEKLVAYKDPVGIPTICSGTTKGVKLGDTATKELCRTMNKREREEAAALVLKYVPQSSLTPERGFALTSFVHNIGLGKKGVKDGLLHLKKNGEPSTLLKMLRAGDIKGACEQFKYWNKAGGRVLNGLTHRRKLEEDLCKIGL